MSEVIWRPSPQRIEQAAITRFGHACGHGDYQALHSWSVSEPEAFWKQVWTFCGVIGERGEGPWLEQADDMEHARWFPNARLNLAENLLGNNSDKTAIIFESEAGETRKLSFQQLQAAVSGLQQAMRALGIGHGDLVAGLMPNVPETVIAMLATASLGAIWTSCSPDFGVRGVLDRFSSVQPKLLFGCDGYQYAGKQIDIRERLQEIQRQLPELQATVLVPCLNHNASLASTTRWDQFSRASASPVVFERVAFDHPVYILYSSGTTGKPKCIVHGHGGTILQHAKELQLHTDVGRDSTLFFYTTCGWMMWNWLVSGLATGATIALWDGAPMHPASDSLFGFAARHRFTHFGTSARFLSAIEKAGARPAATHDLSTLRSVLSTGSPLAPEGFDYVYREIGADLCLSSISGGTDIVSCFALGNPALPVYREQLQCIGLGMDVAVVDEQGHPLREEKGELVCRQPFPSQPVGFWNDEGGARYHKAYFSRFDGIWAHGDYAMHTREGGMVIYGRSDAVLNPGGVRIGTAEIYRQVETLEEILESIVVGQDWEDDVRVVLFVRLRDGLILDDPLRERIRKTIRANATPRHVPALILQVSDIPRTISGKIVELAVRDVIHGREVANTDALANPGALDEFRNRPELS